MSSVTATLGELIKPAKTIRAGKVPFPILSMTMHHGLVDQDRKFKKRIASIDTSQYKVVRQGQLVVGFPIDEGVLSFQTNYPQAIVSPAYNIWDVVDDKQIYRPYLERYLRSPQALKFYSSRLRSTTARRRSLPIEVFLNLSIPLPDLSQQKRISAILDQADALRRLRQRAIDRLNDLSPALFYEMFGDPLENKHKYPIVPLVEIIDQRRPLTYGILKPGPDQPDGVPYVRVVDIKDNRVCTGNLRKTSVTIAKAYKRSTLKPGDLLISIRGHVGGWQSFLQNVMARI